MPEIILNHVNSLSINNLMKKYFLIISVFLLSNKLLALNLLTPPGSNFDLNAWKLQTLDQNLLFTEISASSLVNGYTSDFFYTNSSDGSIVFNVPSNGTPTSGSTYPRVELRQMTSGANWKLTDTNEHYLTAQCKVIAVAQAKPQTIIGQIHGSETNSELLKIRWTGYLSGQCRIESRYELNDATQAEYGVTLASGLSLGDLIDYTITMKNGTITCTVNGVSASQTYTTAYFGTTDAYYFKAGNYLQYNPQTVPDPTVIYGQNQFYKLSLNKLTTSVQAISELNQFSIYPNPAKDKIKINDISSINSNINLQIYDWNGRLVKSMNCIDNQSIDVSDLAKGIYLAKKSNNTSSNTAKFLISK